jgi:hypothetical protein
MTNLYCIYRQVPLYDRFDDHLCGARITPLPMTYRTKALAAKLAARLDQDEYESSFGEVSYWAGPVDDSTFQARYAVGQNLYHTADVF